MYNWSMPECCREIVRMRIKDFSFRLKSQDKLVTYVATHDSKNIYSFR